MPLDADFITEPRSRPRKKRQSGKRQGVRSLTAQTAWLDGQLYWRDGRIVWQLDNRNVAPTQSEISTAHHNLTRLQNLVERAGDVNTELAALVERRTERFQLARHLRELVAPDYSRLASVSRAHNPAAIQRLVDLLTAEALCLNGLPGPDGLQPSQALLRNGALTREPLLNYLHNRDIPDAGHILAALVLGALETHNHRCPPVDTTQLNTTELRRVYAFGRQYGVTDTPALTATLLISHRGVSLAHRCIQAMQSGTGDFISVQLLREWLVNGKEPELVVAMAEIAVPLNEQFKTWRKFTAHSQPTSQSLEKKSIINIRKSRELYLRDLHSSLCKLIQQGANVRLARLVVRFIETVVEAQLQNVPWSRIPLAAINQDYLINTALLFGQKALDFFEKNRNSDIELGLKFLIEHADAIWTLGSLKRTKDANTFATYLHSAVGTDWNDRATPLLTILQNCGSPEIALRCLQVGCETVIARVTWCSEAQYQLFFDLVEQFDVKPEQVYYSWTQELAAAIRGFPSLQVAHYLLGNLIANLEQCPPDIKTGLLHEILGEINRPGLEGARKLTTLLPLVPRLIEFRDTVSDSSLCGEVLCSLFRASREFQFPDSAEAGSSPINAGALQKWMIDELIAEAHRTQSGLSYYRLPTMTGLIAKLAQGDFPLFQSFFTPTLRLQIRDSDYVIEEGIERLKHYPDLIPILAANFTRQPLRCVNFLLRLGQLQNLPTPVMVPLAVFKANSEISESSEILTSPGHQELLALDVIGESKEFQSLALRLQKAQAWLGEPQELPTGVKRALMLPDKIRRELEHLEKRANSPTADTSLQSRKASLRAQLANEAHLTQRVADETRDALTHITVETEMRAIEEKLLDCVRARLEEVVGPLSRTMPVDDDLINAALLTTDIETNRKLLRQLLRCHMEGDSLWHYRLPGNRLFLAVMRARGLNVERWLAAHPRRYRCAGAEGGMLHLRLERHPLQILQMGNYFNTCLSVGGCNSFSTVANACELNKRVVFATDGTGRVVGRQLIGVSTEGKLVGFRVYNSLNSREGQDELNRIFLHYVETFTRGCGIDLANEGEVPILFAQDWYDDGVFRWGAEVGTWKKPGNNQLLENEG